MFFFVFFLYSWVQQPIQWVREFSLYTIEMVESPSQVVRNALVISWVYFCPYSVFEALTNYHGI